MAGDPTAARFPTTCWSLVVAARGRATPSADEALARLCEAYWFPLYAFVRRKGHGPEDARDLTQDYIARLLERGTVEAADPARGRFRSFLLADCTRFLANRREHDRAAKRGGGIVPLSIDVRDAEGRYLREPSHDRTPERAFERAWALALLEGVLARLRAEYEGSGRVAAFEVLKVALTDGPRTLSHAEMARRVGSTEGGRPGGHPPPPPPRPRPGPRRDRGDRRRPRRGRRRDPRPLRRPGRLSPRVRENPPRPV
jgi:DNA-directed RNA polymerase specialized sigma24 family protein